MKKIMYLIGMVLFTTIAFASDRVVNVYGWSGEIPRKLIKQFEEETGIHVNFSSYDNNETLYAKLHAANRPTYDVVIPSTYFVERLSKQGFLKKLDHRRLPHFKNLDSKFLNAKHDPENVYGVPFIWGATGIVYNAKWISEPPKAWRDLWHKRFQERLMLLDDPREIFSLALLSLGYSPNDTHPQHIKKAYLKLKALKSNIKLFATENTQAILIDEDIHLGTVFNGDAFKAYQENKALEFVFPEDGFVIWIDCLSIVNNAPHPDEAYAFVDFLLRAKSAATVALSEGHAITNQAGKALLPKAIRENPMVYPPDEVLKRGVIQSDVSEKSLMLYDAYWQKLKLSF